MKKLKCFLVDDASKSREILKMLIEAHLPELEITGEADSVEAALHQLPFCKPDLLFLDVELKGETGFDLLKSLPSVDFDVIFTTAHDKYAIEALRFSAMDYLMKPVLQGELKEAVKRVFQKKEKNEKSRQIDALVYNINYSNADKKIALPTSSGMELIELSQLLRCEANGNYTTFHLQSGDKILISKTLMEFDQLLTPYYFFRIHQSHLVNLRLVVQLKKGDPGAVLMKDGSVIEIARRKKTEFMSVLKDFALIA
jgi:two-component system LytT family response regulator